MSTHSHFILGTAGHIDHGKSSLIKALTGTDPDRLAEEKRRGITIEVGYARLNLSPTLYMGVVDVPGHERFVRQMISGATGIDIALLCIAADDGIMPQTKEHLDILQLLGIDTCVVALTKADLVEEEWLSFVTEEVENYLSNTRYANSPIVATSSKTGMGLDKLKSVLEQACNTQSERKRGVSARLPIDRVFTIKGSGTVVTGTLWSGTLTQNDDVLLLPSGKTTRIRSIQVHDTLRESVKAGNRVALNLTALSFDEVHPGDFLVSPDYIKPTDRFDAYFTHLDSVGKGKVLKSGTRVRVAHGTKEVMARILLIDSEEALPPQTSARVQIRLEQPLAVSRNDRFIIRSYSPVQVIGGGIVLLTHPRRRTSLTQDEKTLFDALEADDDAAIIIAAALMQQSPFAARDIAYTFEISEECADKEITVLVNQKKLIALNPGAKETYYLARNRLQQMLGKLESLLVSYHSEQATEAGISKSALHQRIVPRLKEDAFDAFLHKAEEMGKIVNYRGIISHPEIGAGISQKENKAAETLLLILEEAGKRPDQIYSVIETSGIERNLAQRALANLEEQGQITRVDKEYYFSSAAYKELCNCVSFYIKAHGNSSAADLKNAMGVSRKHAIPLLEYMDSTGLTRREGEGRILVE